MVGWFNSFFSKKNNQILSVLLFSFFNRVVYSKLISGFDLIGAIGLDSAFYHNLAIQFSKGEPYSDSFFMSPLYSFLLSFLYRVFDSNPQVAINFNLVIGCATAVLVFLIGEKLFNPRVGLLAALFYNLYGFALFLENHILIAPFLVFLLSLFSLVLLKAYECKKVMYFFSAGLIAGMLAIGRGTFLVSLVLGIVIVLFFGNRRVIRKSLIKSAFILLGVVLVVAPVTIHNWKADGEFLLISSNGGINYYIGNNESANGTFVRVPGVSFFQPGTPDDGGSVRLASQNVGHQLSSGEASNYWLRRGSRWNIQNPGRTLYLLGKKFVLVLINYEIPQIENYHWARSSIKPIKFWFIGFGLLFSLGIGGMIISWIDKINTKLVVVIIGTNIIALIPFFITARYRIPIAPLLAVFASAFVFFLVEKVKNRNRSNLLVPILCVILVLCFSFGHVPEVVQAGSDLIEEYTKGVLAVKENRLFDAVQHFEISIQNYPDHIPSHANLGTLYTHFGKYQEGLREFEAVLSLDPENRAVLTSYSICLEKLGFHEKAEKVNRFMHLRKDP